MINKRILSNGLKVVVSGMPHMESIAMGVFIGMGGRYEQKHVCGISHFIEHMLFKGTDSRDARRLKQDIEGVGGQFNGFTSEEMTCFFVRVPARHISLGLDVLSDMVLNPRMDDAEIGKERHVICEEIKMYKDMPSSYVHEILAEAMWPSHPLGRPLAGYESVVERLDRKALLGVKETAYVPSRTAVVAAGAVKKSDFLAAVNGRFRHFPRGKGMSFKPFSHSAPRGNVRIHHKETEQTHIAIGFHCPGRNAAEGDKYALNILNIILGANMSSRLFEEVREKRGLCYDISSTVKKFEETGAFFIHTGVSNDKAAMALEAVMGELVRIKNESVEADELVRAKEFYKGQMLLAFEDTGSRMLWLGDKVMTRDGIPDMRSIPRHIENVRAEDVRKAANMVFARKNINLAAIGPKAALSEKAARRLMEIR